MLDKGESAHLLLVHTSSGKYCVKGNIEVGGGIWEAGEGGKERQDRGIKGGNEVYIGK